MKTLPKNFTNFIHAFPTIFDLFARNEGVCMRALYNVHKFGIFATWFYFISEAYKLYVIAKIVKFFEVFSSPTHTYIHSTYCRRRRTFDMVFQCVFFSEFFSHSHFLLFWVGREKMFGFLSTKYLF